MAAQLYEAGLAAAGIQATCEIHAVAARELALVVDRIRNDAGVIGAAVTMPHTVAVAALLDGLDREAETIRAANTIGHRAGTLTGWNTDRTGFAQALEEAGYSAKGRSALVLGAGGASRACVDALRETAGRIWVSSPDLDQARALCRDLQVSAGGPAPMGSLSLLARKVDLVVNATPVGTDGQGVVLPAEWITPHQFVFDLIYQPPVTPLIERARERGARAINGVSMLLFAGLRAIEIWTGRRAVEAPMRAALQRAVLGRLTS